MNWTVCIKNTGYEASPESRKLCKLEDDPKVPPHGLVRVVDESGESCLYLSDMLAPIAIQETLEGQLLAA